MLCQQAAFERMIEILAVSRINITQRFDKIEHLSRPDANAHFPENAPKFGEPIEEPFAAFDVRWPHDKRILLFTIIFGLWWIHG